MLVEGGGFTSTQGDKELTVVCSSRWGCTGVADSCLRRSEGVAREELFESAPETLWE